MSLYLNNNTSNYNLPWEIIETNSTDEKNKCLLKGNNINNQKSNVTVDTHDLIKNKHHYNIEDVRQLYEKEAPQRGKASMANIKILKRQLLLLKKSKNLEEQFCKVCQIPMRISKKQTHLKCYICKYIKYFPTYYGSSENITFADTLSTMKRVKFNNHINYENQSTIICNNNDVTLKTFILMRDYILARHTCNISEQEYNVIRHLINSKGYSINDTADENNTESDDNRKCCTPSQLKAILITLKKEELKFTIKNHDFIKDSKTILINNSDKKESNTEKPSLTNTSSCWHQYTTQIFLHLKNTSYPLVFSFEMETKTNTWCKYILWIKYNKLKLPIYHDHTFILFKIWQHFSWDYLLPYVCLPTHNEDALLIDKEIMWHTICSHLQPPIKYIPCFIKENIVTHDNYDYLLSKLSKEECNIILNPQLNI